MKGLIGKKIGMTQVYDEGGKVIPVTIVQAGPCVVMDVKTIEKNGYSAVQLGFGERKAKNATMALLGTAKKAGITGNPPASLREIRTAADPQLELGAIVTADIFKADDYLDISGITKGRGFQGSVRRHGFKGGRYSHGGGWKRKPGSVGMRESPGRVFVGKKLPGHMGSVNRTIQNLKIVRVAKEDNLLFIKGAVPGPNGGTLLIKAALKKSK
ncbi:MAG: 50S ribosomal protein L3 [Victivallaceae bacterium]|jgi:large subunit ribosomal protein L3